ncbi:hypothetical protein ACQP1V_42890 (plasmid) [Microtetraspora malaysiensis]|uniref:hypothetical protein n=1 Tax=Microtetraspora malaysiensis TaxID=161358 RepID=UPI003D8C3B00
MQTALAAVVTLVILAVSMGYYLSVKGEDAAGPVDVVDEATRGPLREDAERLSTDLESVSRPTRVWVSVRTSLTVVTRAALERRRGGRDDTPGDSGPAIARPPVVPGPDITVEAEVVKPKPASPGSATVPGGARPIPLGPATAPVPAPAPEPASEVVDVEIVPPTKRNTDPRAAVIALEGIDMSNLPASGGGGSSAPAIPTIGALKVAFATGGISLLRSWLQTFRNANSRGLGDAQRLHDDAMAYAQQTRLRYLQAWRAFEAVGQDKLDRQTANHFLQILERAHAAAAAAAKLTRATAQNVVDAGGVEPAVSHGIGALNRNHGGIEAAVKGAPVRPVRDMTWYAQ